MTDVAADLAAGWSRIPADQVVFNGEQLQRLRDDGQYDVLRDAVVTRKAPAWVGLDRAADLWLVSRDRQTACPLLWNERGDELLVTVVLQRDRVEAAEREAPAIKQLMGNLKRREEREYRHRRLLRLLGRFE